MITVLPMGQKQFILFFDFVIGATEYNQCRQDKRSDNKLEFAVSQHF
jgi:hypothetical protein